MSKTMRNFANMSRFKILHYWEHAFTSAAGVSTAFGLVATAWETYIPLKDMMIRYDGFFFAITDLVSNNIFLIAGSDGNSDDLVTVVGNARLTFCG